MGVWTGVGFLGLLIFLILFSAFFSGSETAMMALNRYRLRHLMRKNNRKALRVGCLLERTDRLLGVILIGNTFANVLASAVATFLAIRWFGDIGVLIATMLLTVVILIFAEVTPKTLAAAFPDKLAFVVAIPLQILLKCLYPLVLSVNAIAAGILKLFHVRIKHKGIEALSREELRTVVHEATAKISTGHQQMLLGVLDLEKITVDDVMVPRGDVYGIDVAASWPRVLEQLSESRHDAVPVFEENLDTVRGMLPVRKIFPLITHHQLNQKTLLEMVEPCYFIPEGTSLAQQLINFRREKLRLGLVVDEYGDILGLLTLEDILEEIIGEFPETLGPVEHVIKQLSDQCYLVSGNMTVRELNRTLKLNLPVEGPKTLAGLIIEALEIIPKAGVGLKLADVPVEVVKVKNNKIKEVKIIVQ